MDALCAAAYWSAVTLGVLVALLVLWIVGSIVVTYLQAWGYVRPGPIGRIEPPKDG